MVWKEVAKASQVLGLPVAELSPEAWETFKANYQPMDPRLLAIDTGHKPCSSSIWNFDTLQ